MLATSGHRFLEFLRRYMRFCHITLLILMMQAASAQDKPPGSDAPRGTWATAPRHSAGIAPDPLQWIDSAIVQVYAAGTYGWRGYFAVHPWIIYKRRGEVSYTRYDVVGWRAPNVVQRNYAVPDGLWYGATPKLLVDHRGTDLEPMVDAIEAATRGATLAWGHFDVSLDSPRPTLRLVAAMMNLRSRMSGIGSLINSIQPPSSVSSGSSTSSIARR